MSDLLRPLLDAIETVRARISNHRTYLESDERRTRVSLVDPILHALGWDPSDPESVALEWKIEGESADYALLGDDGKPVAIVEAKKLGTSLGLGPRRQTGGYVLGAKVDLAALTDGNRWNIYDLKRAGSGDVVSGVTISTDEHHTTALQLLELWRPQVRSERKKSHPSWPTHAGETKGADAPGPAPPPPKPPADDEWILLDKIRQDKKHRPLAIRFEDGVEWPTPELWSVLEGAIVWLYERGALAEAHMPLMDQANERPVVHLPSGAAEMLQPRRPRDTPFVFEGHGNARMHRERFGRLMSMCGHSAASVFAKPRR